MKYVHGCLKAHLNATKIKLLSKIDKVGFSQNKLGSVLINVM